MRRSRAGSSGICLNVPRKCCERISKLWDPYACGMSRRLSKPSSPSRGNWKPKASFPFQDAAARRKSLSSSLHTNEAVRVNFVRLGLETSVETSSSPFMEGIAPPHTQESGWTGLSPSRESPRFVAPTWECPGASPAQDSSDTQLQEAVQKQIEVLLRGAEREAQHIKEEAYAAGFATGEEQGFEAGARL